MHFQTTSPRISWPPNLGQQAVAYYPTSLGGEPQPTYSSCKLRAPPQSRPRWLARAYCRQPSSQTSASTQRTPFTPPSQQARNVEPGIFSRKCSLCSRANSHHEYNQTLRFPHGLLVSSRTECGSTPIRTQVSLGDQEHTIRVFNPRPKPAPVSL